MTTTAAPTGFAALAIVHPHHADLIRTHTSALHVGTVVRITGKTEGFYSGLLSGDLATLTDESAWSWSVQHIDGDTPHLSVSKRQGPETRVDAIDPTEWTADNARAAQRTAENGATALMERAYRSVNGLLGAPIGDDAALDALREAHTLRSYAFACGVLAEALSEGYEDRSYWASVVRKTLADA